MIAVQVAAVDEAAEKVPAPQAVGAASPAVAQVYPAGQATAAVKLPPAQLLPAVHSVHTPEFNQKPALQVAPFTWASAPSAAPVPVLATHVATPVPLV